MCCKAANVTRALVVFVFLAMLALMPSEARADETRDIRNGMTRALEGSNHMLRWVVTAMDVYLAAGGNPSSKEYTDAAAARAALEAGMQVVQAALNKRDPSATYDELGAASQVLWFARDNLYTAVSPLETLIPPESAPDLLILRDDLKKQVAAANNWLVWATVAIDDYMKAGGASGSKAHADAAVAEIRMLVHSAQAKLDKKNPPATYDELDAAFNALGNTQGILVSAIAPLIDATHVLNASADLGALVASAPRSAADAVRAMGKYLARGGMPTDSAYLEVVAAASQVDAGVQAAQAALVADGRGVPGGRVTVMRRAERNLQVALDRLLGGIRTLDQAFAHAKTGKAEAPPAYRGTTPEQINEMIEESRRFNEEWRAAREAEKKAPQVALTVGQRQAWLNGVPYTLDTAVFVRNGRALVPLRFVSEALDAEVDWVASSRQAVIQDGGTRITLAVGTDRAMVNGASQTLDRPAELVSARVFVPLRFVSEALGAQVDYNAGTGQIVIIK